MFPDTGIIDMHVDERINQSETLWLTVRASDEKARELKADVELVLPNGRRYFIVETLKARNGAEALVTVQAEAAWTKLADSKHIGTLAFAGNNLADVLTFVVDLKDFQGWTYALDGVSPTTDVSFEANDASMLDLIRKCAQVARCEVHFDTATNVVTFVDELGTDRGLAFTYARNLNTVERRENPPKVTRLWPFGKDGLTIAAVEPDDLPYLEDFSFYTAQGITEDQARARYLKEHIWKDDKYITAQTLYDRAQDVIAELAEASVNYTLGVTDLTGLTQITEDDYVLGDTVLTTDAELHFTNVATRVVRIDRYPLEPWRTELELSFLPVVAPDPNVSDARSDTRLEWNLFASRNTDTVRYVGAVRTVLNRLVVNTITGAEWIVAYSLNAVATGTGTVTIEAIDANSSDAPICPPVTLDVTSGDPVHWTFSFGELNVEPGQYNLVVRAEGNSGGELNVDELGTALYVLARGTTQQDLTLIDSIRYDVTGAIQEFEVPDDVSEIRIECHGSAGGMRGGNEDMVLANGGMMTASFTVLPGELYDVYVGEWTEGNDGEANGGGWPDGGYGTTNGTLGAGGGGRSEVRPQGGAITDALIIAGAGGGKGSADIHPATDCNGGPGGYPNGADAGNGDHVGSGGTQIAGGDGAGATAFGDGAQGQGGHGVEDDDDPSFGGSPTTVGGGGGGGWYGGGGGAYGFGAIGGGGGSGYVGDGAYDLEVLNAENAGPGYVIISWQNPLDA